MNTTSLTARLFKAAALVASVLAATIASAGVLTINDTTAGNPTWNRPIANGTSAPTQLSGTGTAVAYDVTHGDPEILYFSVFHLLLELKLVEENDLVILTKGELSGVSGGTNSMQILRVTRN